LRRLGYVELRSLAALLGLSIFPISTAPRALPPIDSDSNAIRAGYAEAPLPMKKVFVIADAGPPA